MPKAQRESIAKLKKQIRDTERLLKRPALPPHIQIAQQRKLKALQSLALPQALTQKKEDTTAAKYKMVKFFEQKKLLSRLKRALRSTGDNQQQQQQQLITKLKMQLNYVAHFPRDRGYISLFPRHPCTDQSVLEEQSAIMSAIDERVQAGEVEDAAAKLLAKATKDTVESEDQASDVEPKAKKNRKAGEQEQEESASDDEEDLEEGSSDEDQEGQEEGDSESGDEDEEDLDEEDDEEYSEGEDDEEAAEETDE